MFDTIIAQVTPQGNAGVYILRISGNKAYKVSLEVLGKILKPRYASYLKFFDINHKEILDQGIGIWFPSPHSYTGEDVLELQGHGNNFIANLLIKRILKIPGIRISRPGEFSERAFLNNKIDLIQAEAVADLINASSEASVKAALKSLSGFFSDKINKIIQKVINVRVMVESQLDFSEEDINVNFQKKFLQNIQSIIHDLDNLLFVVEKRKIIKEGIKVIIAGFPNAGKSSLFNLLSCKKSSIVTNIKGTTRDLINNKIYFDKFLIDLTDTAGLRRAQDKVEKIGISLAKKEISSSDIVLFLIDSTKEKKSQLKKFLYYFKNVPRSINIILLFNKIDLKNISPTSFIFKDINCFYISVKKKMGLKNFYLFFRKILKKYNNSFFGESNFLARQRHLEEIYKAKEELILCKKEWKEHQNYEIIAEYLKISQNSLNKIIGKVCSHDILNKIFSRFCIGK
ncbi:tRNA uridine-5-carboxymethylaminomethyl(34) synthesis GTPase MnmE [Buchnera aphidicola]|uniref:tRNA uridine-5-carboxymethylaminomethyl(34) synthesis GTPase MnmE n=1 Tax=Buchnera aphidicola TaxID=9 RepID=UPI00346438B8